MSGAEIGVSRFYVPERTRGAETSIEKKRGRLAPLLCKSALKLTGLTLAGAVVFAGVEYAWDVEDVEDGLKNTHPYVAEYAQPPASSGIPPAVPRGAFEAMAPTQQRAVQSLEANGNLAVITFSGVGQSSLPDSGEVMKPFDSIAANLAMVYDPNGIDTDTNVAAINALTDPDAQNITSFVVYGDSAGAPIGIDTAVHLLEVNPKVRIQSIIVDSGALDETAVRRTSRDEASTMLQSFGFPGISHSRDAREVGELVMKRDKIHDVASFMKLEKEVHHEVFDNPQLPTNELIGDEAMAFFDSPVHRDLLKLGRLPESRRPLIFFIGAKDPAQDDVVNDTKSLALLKAWTKEAHLILEAPDTIENISHGQPALSMDQYHAIFKKHIIPAIVRKMDGGTISASGK